MFDFYKPTTEFITLQNKMKNTFIIGLVSRNLRKK